MRNLDVKTCYCYNCDKWFHSLGISRHRAKHRDNREDCKIKYPYGVIKEHQFSKKVKQDGSE